jgi:hypothetical protein
MPVHGVMVKFEDQQFFHSRVWENGRRYVEDDSIQNNIGCGG